MDPFKRRGLLKTESTSRSVVWLIEHYHSLLELEHYICSDIFRVPSISNSLFYLFLSLEGNVFSLYVYKNTRLRSESSNAKSSVVRVVIAIKDPVNQIQMNKELTLSKENATPPVVFGKSIESSRFVNEGCLEIHCTVIHEEIEQPQNKQKSKELLKNYVPNISCNELKEHLQVMLDGEVDNNVTLFVDGEVFQVHRNLLCSHSSVFAAMFEHDTLEKAQNHIHIDDVCAEAIGEILSFIYFGSTSKMSHKLALEVYAAADKYAIINLRRKCVDYLISNLTKEVVLEVLLVGDRHSDNELRVATIQYLVKNAAGVIESEAFLQLLESEAELARSIILHLAKTINN